MISIKPPIDRGPGVAGRDFDAWDGTYGPSHNRDNECCGLCRRGWAAWSNYGCMVWGFGGGSNEIYIWTARGDAVAPPCYLCDECVNICVGSGGLEYAGTWDGSDQDIISPAAKRELFAMGAREAVAAFWDIQDAEGPCERQFVVPTPPEIMDRIHAFSLTMGKSTNILKVGRAYGTAALAFGQANGDPGFEGAAARFAEGAAMARKKYHFEYY